VRSMGLWRWHAVGAMQDNMMLNYSLLLISPGFKNTIIAAVGYRTLFHYLTATKHFKDHICPQAWPCVICAAVGMCAQDIKGNHIWGTHSTLRAAVHLPGTALLSRRCCTQHHTAYNPVRQISFTCRHACTPADTVVY
jgi:hypothetical protein